ncbi:hypothetical protein G6F31_021749 [Rhizopus arrhizus]|nr:hypothetical protein G6F31_021749 [Rhizopus arrhizus]
MSATGIVTVAPAATACFIAASTSFMYRCSVTGEPFSALAPRLPHSGKSSISISTESPIRMAACMILPLGPGKRASSSALKAFL